MLLADLALQRGEVDEAHRRVLGFADDGQKTPMHRTVKARVGLARGEPGSRQALEESRAAVLAQKGGDNYYLLVADRALAGKGR